MRTWLALPLILAACAPPNPVTYTVTPTEARASYRPPNQALSPSPAPADPWQDADEKSYFTREFALLDTFRCRQISSADAALIGTRVRLDRSRLATVSDARRQALYDAAVTQVRTSIRERQPCVAAAYELTTALRRLYLQRPVSGAAPRQASAPQTTNPPDTGWQPGAPASRPPPTPTPDQLDL